MKSWTGACAPVAAAATDHTRAARLEQLQASAAAKQLFVGQGHSHENMEYTSTFLQVYLHQHTYEHIHTPSHMHIHMNL